MADFTAFQQRKKELLDALDRLIGLVGQESVVWDTEAEVRTLTRFKDGLSGDLLFKVLCVGDFSTGKSTFINRFLLEQDLLPAYPIPTTTLPTRIRYGAQLKALLYSAEGEPQEVTEGVRERLIECVAGPNVDQVRTVFLEVPASRLAAGVEVIDAPGLNDPDLERMRITLDNLNQADAVLFFLNAMQPGTAYEVQFFESELLTLKTLKRLFVIANYWDQIDAPERDEVLAFIKQRLGESLRRGSVAGSAPGDLPILPVSAKTGENADAVQRQIWDEISATKFSDVLSLRLKRFNDYVDRYRRDLDNTLASIKLDRKQRARRRADLVQETEGYRGQSEQFRRDLRRLLKPEFTDYSSQLGHLFDDAGGEVDRLIREIASVPQDVQRVNTRLASRMSQLQDRTKRRLRDIDDAFLERVKSLVEAQKGLIAAPLTNAVTLDEYFLQWPGIAAGDWDQYGGRVSGGIGIAGLLVGAGTFLPALAAPVAAPTLWGSLVAFMVGTGAPVAVASPWVVFGIPGLVVGVLALAGSRYFVNLAWEHLKEKLADLSEDLQGSIEKQKWQLIDQIRQHQDARIETICNDVDHEIMRAYRERLGELDQIDRIEDNGDALQTLRDNVAALTFIKVNP